MANLTSTKSVMRFNGRTELQHGSGEVVECAEFLRTDIEAVPEDQTPSSEAFYLAVPVWDDMGQPAEITLTVEPGDKLNR